MARHTFRSFIALDQMKQPDVLLHAFFLLLADVLCFCSPLSSVYKCCSGHRLSVGLPVELQELGQRT